MSLLSNKQQENQDKDVATQFKKKIEEFIVNESYDLSNKYDRSYLLSVFLVAFRQFEIIQFNINQQLYDDVLDGNENTNGFIKILIVELWPFQIIEAIFFILFSINVALVLLILVKLFLYLSNKNIKNHSIGSFFFRTYTHVNFIASLYTSITVFQTHIHLSIINITLSLILQYTIATNDYDYRYVVKDYLAKKSQKHDYFFITLKIIAVFVQKFGTSISLPFVGFGFNLLKLLYHYIFHPHQDFKIQALEFSLTLTNMFISFILIIVQFKGPQADFIFCMVCCIPLSYQTGQIMIQYKLDSTIQNCICKIKNQSGIEKTSRNLESIDLLLRYFANNLSCTLAEYIGSPYSLYLEKIVSEHHKTCLDYPNCFCKNYGENVSRIDFIGESVRKQYIENFIRSVYIDEIQQIKQQISEFLISYFAFLINYMKNQTVSFREILTLKQRYYNKATIREKQLINYIFDQASQEFKLEAQQIFYQTHGQMLDIILFDQSLEESQQLYKQCLKEKQELLIIMSRDYINLLQLEKIAFNLQEKRTRLQNNLTRLFKVNSLNNPLLSLCEGFEECLTIEPIFRNMYLNQIKTGKRKIRIPYYSDDSCAIYISLLNDVGKILKVSKNFHEVVPLVKKNSEAISKNIKFIICDEIANVHDNILLNCVSKKFLSQDVKHIPIAFGKDSDGWARVYHFKVQICMLENRELGACGWVKQVNDGNIYVLTSSILDDYRFFIVENKFYQSIFKGNFTQSDIKNIKLQNLMPIMKYLGKKSKDGSVYESIIIKPTSLKEAMTEKDILDDTILQNLFKMNLFSIKFTFYQVNGQFVQFTAFQIIQLKPLTHILAKKDALKNFRLQINEYVDTETLKNKMNEQINLLNQVKEPTKQQLENITQLKTLTLIAEESQQKSVFGNPSPTFRRKSRLFDLTQIEKMIQKDFIPLNEQKNNIEDKGLFNNTEQQIFNETQRESSFDYISPINGPYKQDDTQLDYSYNLKKLQNQNQQKPLINKINLSDQLGSSLMINSNEIGGRILQQKNPLQDGSSKNQYDMKESQLIFSPSHQGGQISFQLSQRENKSFQNILSQDINHFSPVSSQRKPLLFPDTNRLNISEAINQDSTIIENSNEQDNHSNQTHDLKDSARPRQSSFKSNLTSKRPRNVSIAKNYQKAIKSPNQEQNSTFAQALEDFDQEISNQADNEFNEGGRKFTEEREKDSSVQTGKTTKSSTRMHMISTIRSKKVSSGFKILNFLGMIAVALICGLNLISFFIQYNDSLKQQSNFQKIFWIYQIKKYISLSFGQFGIQASLDKNIYDFIKNSDEQQLIENIKQNNQFVYASYKNFVEMIQEKKEKPVYVFDITNSYPMEMKLLNGVNISISSKINTTLSYEIIYFQNLIYYMTSNQDPQGIYKEQGTINYINIFDGLEIVYSKNLDNFNKQIDESNLLIMTQLISISVVTFIFSMMLIPVQIISSKKKEEILKLFATFSPDKVVFMMSMTNRQIELQERVDFSKQKFNSFRGDFHSMHKSKQFEQSMKQKLNSSNQGIRLSQSSYFGNVKNIENIKKKNISSTNDIPKLTVGIFIIILIGFSCMQFYGISKYIIGVSQLNDFQTSLNFLESFDQFYDTIANLISVRYLFPITRYLSPKESSDLKAFINIVQEYQKDSKARLTSLIDQFNKYDDYDGNQKSGIDKFLLPMFKDNLCDTINNESEGYVGEVQFDYQSCQYRFGGVFQQGLIVASKKYIQLFDTFADGYLNAGQFQELKDHLQKLNEEMSVLEEYDFSIMIMVITKIIHNFFQVVYQINFDNQSLINILLLSIQMVILLIVLTFGWRRYYNNLGKQFFSTKQFLDLIDLNILLDNPYVVSYFKRNS